MVDELVATFPRRAELRTQDTHQLPSGTLGRAGDEMVVYPDEHARPSLADEHRRLDGHIDLASFPPTLGPAMEHLDRAHPSVSAVQPEPLVNRAPRFRRNQGLFHAGASFRVRSQKMDVAVDSKGRQRRVVNALRERPHDQFAKARVGCLLRLGDELLVRNLQMKPVRRKICDLRVNHLYLGALFESVTEEPVVGEPSRREDGRIELPSRTICMLLISGTMRTALFPL